MNNATFLRSVIYQDYKYFSKFLPKTVVVLFYFSNPAPAVIAGKHQLFQKTRDVEPSAVKFRNCRKVVN